MKLTREKAIENVKAIMQVEKSFDNMDAILNEMFAVYEKVEQKDTIAIRMDMERKKQERIQFCHDEKQKLIKEYHIKSWEIYG